MKICKGTSTVLHEPIAFDDNKWDCPMCSLLKDNSELRSIIASQQARMEEKGIT